MFLILYHKIQNKSIIGEKFMNYSNLKVVQYNCNEFNNVSENAKIKCNKKAVYEH